MKSIFVIGTGRSGTHFTVRLLNGFANAHDPLGGKENEQILMEIAKAAIHHRLPSPMVVDYYRGHLNAQAGIYLDQHHPNLFYVRHWARMFEGIVFVYPRRPTYQIVASMLRHGDVMSWYQYAQHWRQRWIDKIPYPNQFLGLARFSDIANLPTHLLCAHRVIAHRLAYEEAAKRANADLRSLDYVALVDDPLVEFSRAFTAKELEALGKFTLLERPKKDSLTKYCDILDDRQLSEIEALERQICDD